MKNKLTDLNDHLFAQLERLGNEDLQGEELMNEIERSRAVSLVGRQLIDNARVLLDAHKHQQEFSRNVAPTPVIFGLEQKP